MAKLINASINLDKIDKSKIYVSDKGVKYLNITIKLHDEPDQYGNDCMLSQSQSKEQRERKEYGAILGNGKVVWEERKTRSQPQQTDFLDGVEDDDLCF